MEIVAIIVDLIGTVNLKHRRLYNFISNIGVANGLLCHTEARWLSPDALSRACLTYEKK